MGGESNPKEPSRKDFPLISALPSSPQNFTDGNKLVSVLRQILLL